MNYYITLKRLFSSKKYLVKGHECLDRIVVLHLAEDKGVLVFTLYGIRSIVLGNDFIQRKREDIRNESGR